VRAATLATAALAVLSAAAAQSYREASDLAAAGELRAALAAADAVAGPLEREQSRLHVLWTAGDLAGALAAGRAGLRLAPDDPYLLERTLGLATALGAAPLAAELAPRLERRFAELDAGEREAFAPSVGARLAEARELAARATRRAAALWRAKATVALLMAGLLLAAGVLSRARPATGDPGFPSPRPGRSASSAPPTS